MVLFGLLTLAACGGRASQETSEAGTQACTTAVPPASAARAVSLTLAGADFGDVTRTDWERIGFNLDGACTTTTSINTCALASDAPGATQVDGAGGIDNSFGANVCPVLDSLFPLFCSTAENVIVVTHDSGDGTLAILFTFKDTPLWVEIPLTDTFVLTGPGGAGMLGGTVRTSALVDALRPLWGTVTHILCSAQSSQAADTAVAQSSDILSTGMLAPGEACDSTSIGVAFTGSAPYTGALPLITNPCAADAGTD
jgi:hypothetical protein